jgi:hypothetical protein
MGTPSIQRYRQQHLTSWLVKAQGAQGARATMEILIQEAPKNPKTALEAEWRRVAEFRGELAAAPSNSG